MSNPNWETILRNVDSWIRNIDKQLPDEKLYCIGFFDKTIEAQLSMQINDTKKSGSFPILSGKIRTLTFENQPDVKSIDKLIEEISLNYILNKPVLLIIYNSNSTSKPIYDVLSKLEGKGTYLFGYKTIDLAYSENIDNHIKDKLISAINELENYDNVLKQKIRKIRDKLFHEQNYISIAFSLIPIVLTRNNYLQEKINYIWLLRFLPLIIHIFYIYIYKPNNNRALWKRTILNVVLSTTSMELYRYMVPVEYSDYYLFTSFNLFVSGYLMSRYYFGLKGRRLARELIHDKD